MLHEEAPINEEIKARIRAKSDMVAIISEHTTLIQSGSNFKGICPSCKAEPSCFFVYPSREYWHCFGPCSEGGDIIRFVELIKDLPFRKAVEQLATRAGIELPW